MRQGEPVYTITDYAGDDVTGTFYEPEMQSVLVEENALYKLFVRNSHYFICLILYQGSW